MGIINTIKKVLGGQSADSETKYELPVSFYIDSLEAERVQKDHFFRTNAYSPLTDRAGFTGLNYYPVDPDLRLELPLEPTKIITELTILTSTGDEQTYVRLGTVAFEVNGQPGRLAVYRSPHHNDLFLPFRDATSGTETYGAGRYLEPAELGNGQLVVDFNLAYNPYCAYSEHYSCPLPPLENRLKVPIRAGEKSYQPDAGH
jgi:uncharacterized protein (DUF1684 family)